MSHTEKDKPVWSGDDEEGSGSDISPIAETPIRDATKSKGHRLKQIKNEHQPVLSSSSADLAVCVDPPVNTSASMLAMKKKHRRSTSLSSPLTAAMFAHALEADLPRSNSTPSYSFTLTINFVGTNGLTMATADFNFSKDNTVKEVLLIAYAMKVKKNNQTSSRHHQSSSKSSTTKNNKQPQTNNHNLFSHLCVVICILTFANPVASKVVIRQRRLTFALRLVSS